MAKKDFVRAYIIAKKIKRSSLDEPQLEDVKIRFFELMIDYHGVDRDALELAKSYLKIYETAAVREDDANKHATLSSAALFACLAPYDNHQSDLMHRTLADKRLPEIPAYHDLLKKFATPEIIHWPLQSEGELFAHPTLTSEWQSTLHDRVVEHNIRVVAAYFSTIPIERLASFLRLTPDEAEDHVSRMVTSKLTPLFARIDRPSGTVSFAKRKTADDHLSDWAGDIATLLGLVEKTCHVIDKEETMHRVGKTKK